MRFAAKNLRIQISRFESLESLTRVGLEMDTAMQESIGKGNLIRQLLRQLRFANRDVLMQIIALGNAGEAAQEARNLSPGNQAGG